MSTRKTLDPALEAARDDKIFSCDSCYGVTREFRATPIKRLYCGFYYEITRETTKLCHTVRLLARQPAPLHRMNTSKTLDPALGAARDDKRVSRNSNYGMTKEFRAILTTV
jgi:hypothetical protein